MIAKAIIVAEEQLPPPVWDGNIPEQLIQWQTATSWVWRRDVGGLTSLLLSGFTIWAAPSKSSILQMSNMNMATSAIDV